MTSNNLDEEFMSKAIQVVEENISNEDFTSDELASQALYEPFITVSQDEIHIR